MFNRQIYRIIFHLTAALQLSVTCSKTPSDSPEDSDKNIFEYLSYVAPLPESGGV